MELLSDTEFAKYLGVSDPDQYASIAFAMNSVVNLIGKRTSVLVTLSWPPIPHWILILPYGHPNKATCVCSVG
nr:MAG TPA: hypothetical protein [Caudoviricetes sp.]